MPAPSLSAEQLLRWNDHTATQWHELLKQHPDALAIPCDVMNVGTVGGLLHHICAIELRYAQRLAAREETPLEAVGKGSVEACFAAHKEAVSIFGALIADDSYIWQQPMEFNTMTLGRLRSTREAIFIHAMMHGIRHYAQLATEVRQAGIKPNWPMDYMPMASERIGDNI